MIGGTPLVRRSAAILAMRLSGATLVFLLQAAIARLWGADMLGRYLLLIAAINLLAVVMPLGFQVIGTYFAADYAARGEGRMLRSFATRAYLHIVVVTTFIIALVGVGGSWSSHALGWHQIWPAAICLSALTAVIYVSGALLIGLRRPLQGFMADTLLKPVALAIGFGVAVAIADAEARLNVLLWTACLVCAAIVALQMGQAARAIAGVTSIVTTTRAETRRWWRFALPWTLLTLATDFFFDIDLLLLSRLMSIDDLAVFGVCARIFGLIAFGIATIYAVTLPESIAADPGRNSATLCRKMAEANVLACAFALAAAVAALFAGPLLGLFGPAFTAGATPLAILCLGLLARSMAGPGALVLSIHDRPYASLPPAALGLATLVVSNVLLVPAYGLTGAATAATAAMVVWSAAQWFVALRHTAIDVSVWPRLRSAIGLRRAA